MDINDLVAQIVTLPRRFHSLENISMFSLLEGTGYFGSYDQSPRQTFESLSSDVWNALKSGSNTRKTNERSMVCDEN